MKSLSPLSRFATALVAFTALATALASTLATAQDSKPVEVNRIAATVNGRVITMNQIWYLLGPYHRQLTAKYPRRGKEFHSLLNEAQSRILQELIDRAIILDEYERLGLKLPPSVVENDIRNQINRLHGGSKSKFLAYLRDERLNMESFRKMTEEKLIVQAMRASHISEAAPPLPNEIRAEYNKVKNEMRDTSKDTVTFRQIIIPSSDPTNLTATPESQLAHAEDLANDIKKGADFAELAKLHSKGPFADQGGLQEDLPRLDLAGEFAAIIFDAKEGEIIGPLVDRKNFTIIKPLKINFGPPPSFSEVRDIIEERVRRKKTSAEYERWIEKRRKRAMINIKR